MPRRGESNQSLPFRLHGLFLNTQTGHMEAALEWPVASDLSRLIPAPQGKFLVITSDKLMLYSPERELLKELTLAISREGVGDLWKFVPSPGGEYLIIEYELREHHEFEANRDLSAIRTQLIAVEELVVAQTWRPKRFEFVDSISDGGVVLNGGKIGMPQGPYDWPCDPLKAFPRTDYCRPGRFLNNTLLLSKDHSVSTKSVYFVSINGELLFSERYPEGDVFREAVSADGRRLAVAAFKGKGGMAFLHIWPRYVLKTISIYDIPTRRWVYTLDATKQKIKLDPVRREFALSPDGSLLGVITKEGILKLYRIP